MKNKPLTVYIAGLNLGGLWSHKPLKGHFDVIDKCYWDNKSGVCVSHIGLHKYHYGLITFASTSKKEVQVWIDGVLSSFQLLKKWVQ